MPSNKVVLNFILVKVIQQDLPSSLIALFYLLFSSGYLPIRPMFLLDYPPPSDHQTVNHYAINASLVAHLPLLVVTLKCYV